MQISITKSELVRIVNGNFKKHQVEYADALNGYYRTLAIYHIAAHAAAREQHDPKPEYHLKPVSHATDYERILRMLEITGYLTISLNESDFSKYVEDNWEWRATFAQSTQMYGSSSGS